MLSRYIQNLSLSAIPDVTTLKRFGKMIELPDSRSNSRSIPSTSNAYNVNSSQAFRNNAFNKDNRDNALEIIPILGGCNKIVT